MSKNAALWIFFGFLAALINDATCEHGGGEHMMHTSMNFHFTSTETSFIVLKGILSMCIVGAICICGACVCLCLGACHDQRKKRKEQARQDLEQNAQHGTIVPIYSSNPAKQKMDVCPMANRRVSVLSAHDVNNQPPMELDAQSLNVPIFADNDNRPLTKNDYC